MTDGIIIFLVDVFQRSEVFQRAADGFGEMLLAHEYPEALHTALCACLHLDRENVHVLNGEVVDFGNALACLFPVIHEGALDGSRIAHHFQTCHHFRDTAFVHQVLWRACHDQPDKLLRHVAIETQCGKQETGIEKEIFDATLVCLGIKGKTIGCGCHYRSDDTGKGEQMEGFANLITAIAIGNLVEGQLLPYLMTHAMERNAKEFGIGTTGIFAEIREINRNNLSESEK